MDSWSFNSQTEWELKLDFSRNLKNYPFNGVWERMWTKLGQEDPISGYQGHVFIGYQVLFTHFHQESENNNNLMHACMDVYKAQSMMPKGPNSIPFLSRRAILLCFNRIMIFPKFYVLNITCVLSKSLDHKIGMIVQLSSTFY